MAYAVLWIDTEEAKIFKFRPGNTERLDLKRTASEHHGLEDKAASAYFHRVADHLKDATELLVVGPGLAKKHFIHHLEHHNHQALAKKVIAVENMDHPTDNQIKAEARKFFRTHDLFESI
jgi:stalled ribosome rescue protein Dom34